MLAQTLCSSYNNITCKNTRLKFARKLRMCQEGYPASFLNVQRPQNKDEILKISELHSEADPEGIEANAGE